MTKKYYIFYSSLFTENKIRSRVTEEFAKIFIIYLKNVGIEDARFELDTNQND